ncbi:MAG TPA: PIG-L deacetylase family protein [Actinomycetota bacterium]
MAHRLAAVFAHPDDDTFGLAGTLALNPDCEYTVIVATSGDAGMISEPTLATKENLGEVREHEERNALAAVGKSDANIHFLRYPDMGLAEAPRDELVAKVMDLLIEAGPEVVVTFGPEGVTGHSDHVTIGEVATTAFHDARGRAGPGQFQRLFYNSVAQSDLDLFYGFARQAGIDVGNPGDPFRPRGVPDETIAVRIDCSSVIDRKLEAIRAHATQSNELQGLPDELVKAMFSREYFVRAWPQRGSAEGPGSDLFEGLDEKPA